MSLILQGTATQLQPGDAILIVGDERWSRRQRPITVGMSALSLQSQTDTTKGRHVCGLG